MAHGLRRAQCRQGHWHLWRPGLVFHTFEYEPLGAALAAGGVNALAFDFRGHGRSDGPRGRSTLAELTTDTRAALDEGCRRWTGPMVLFGNSLGAMVSILTGTGLHKAPLVLQGGHDLLQPPEQSELIYAAAPELKQYEVLDNGHLPNLDAPDTLSAAITAWADTLDRRLLP